LNTSELDLLSMNNVVVNVAVVKAGVIVSTHAQPVWYDKVASASTSGTYESLMAPENWVHNAL
jgi:hypothetical protein